MLQVLLRILDVLLVLAALVLSRLIKLRIRLQRLLVDLIGSLEGCLCSIFNYLELFEDVYWETLFDKSQLSFQTAS